MLSRVGRHRQKPDVSVVVVVYNIPREAPRTLFSLSPGYQRHIRATDYEVIIVDNASDPPLDRGVIEKTFGENFRLIRIDAAPPSPAHAVNRGLAEARGEIIGVMVDGARLVTPGLLHFARRGARLYERAVVATLGWYLGHDFQSWAMLAGYDKRREDALLSSVDWQRDGYRLFEVSTLDESSVDGWLTPISESNALFLRREMWRELGGLDERFDAPGGGFLNLDTYRRALELPGTHLVVLLGEGTFHQLHGGVSTNLPVERQAESQARWAAQYAAIRGQPYGLLLPRIPTTYLGVLPRPALLRFVQAAIDPVWPNPHIPEPPLGPGFDRSLWSLAPTARPADPAIAAVVELAESEFRAGRRAAAAAVARLVRARAADEPAPQRLLAHASQWSVGGWLPADQRAAAHAALGDAYRLLGDHEQAATEFRAALTLDANLVAAHIGLARLRMPGPEYEVWLDRLHEALRPETYLEIGVFMGSTLALARPPTRVFVVDPKPSVMPPPKTETHFFAETSDAFFAARRLEAALDGRPIKLALIDGLHAFEQCLRDFMNVERWCGSTSVILLHHTVPLDEPTQRRKRETQFWTGDVWRTLLALKHYRPDLDVFTVAAAPTGLSVVTGLDPSSHVLAQAYDEAVRRFIDVPFAEIEHRLDEAFNIIPNDWETVAARLRRSGTL
jgi:tetratricopeptide (TPR) repeat protein